MLSQLQLKVVEIQKEIGETEDHLKVLRGNLNLLQDLIEKEPKGTGTSIASRLMSSPLVRLNELVKDQAKLLRQFTKGDVWNGINLAVPSAQFEKKSVDKPLRDLIVKGLVKEVRRGVGNQPHVYEWVEANSSKAGNR